MTQQNRQPIKKILIGVGIVSAFVGPLLWWTEVGMFTTSPECKAAREQDAIAKVATGQDPYVKALELMQTKQKVLQYCQKH